MIDDFEASRATLTAHAYQMLGDLARAEELVQEAWLRWSAHHDEIRSPRAWLARVVTNLCLNDLASARSRREEPSGTHLPDVVASPAPFAEEVPLAFLVLLQRLTPDERAVLLLHEVFDFTHAEIAEHLGRTPTACRQLLRRARIRVRERRVRARTDPETHQQMLDAFVQASRAGDLDALLALLAPDATLIVDAPDGTRFGGVRNLLRPLVGREQIAALLAHTTPTGARDLTFETQPINGLPSVLTRRDGVPTALIALHVVDGAIASVFIQADPSRLTALT